MIASFEVGDWSYDGHNQYNRYLYEVNLDEARLIAAFHQGLTKLGQASDGTDEFKFCKDYEDNTVPTDFVKSLRSTGLSPETFFDRWHPAQDDDEGWTGTPGTFSLLWLSVAKIGDPNLVFREIRHDFSIQPGGYGLFT